MRILKEVHVRFCKRRGTDNFFLMVNLPVVSVFTFYLFWVKVPLSQHRPALLCSKMEIQISHKNEKKGKSFIFMRNLYFHFGLCWDNGARWKLKTESAGRLTIRKKSSAPLLLQKRTWTSLNHAVRFVNVPFEKASYHE